MIISVVVTAFFLSLLSCASAAEGSHCVRCPGEDRGKQKLSTSSTDDTNIYCVYGKELCGYYLVRANPPTNL